MPTLSISVGIAVFLQLFHFVGKSAIQDINTLSMHCIALMHQCINAMHQCIALHWISVSVAATDPNSFSSYYSLSLQVAAVILWNYQLSFCHRSDFDSDHLEGSLFIDLAIMTPAAICPNSYSSRNSAAPSSWPEVKSSLVEILSLVWNMILNQPQGCLPNPPIPAL